MSDEQYDAALDLLRRLDPESVPAHLKAIIALVPGLQEVLLESVDQPLEMRTCKDTARDYLICDYNRDGNSHRSPWSNKYDPPNEAGNLPEEPIRKLEVLLNESLVTYRNLYYEGGLSSAYLWGQDNGLAGVVLLKKCLPHGLTEGPADPWAADSCENAAGWDSVHVFEVEERGKVGNYKLTSTIMLHMKSRLNASLGELNMSGNLMRQHSASLPLEDKCAHVHNIGRLVEEMENRMRNSLREVYFGKTKDVTDELRSLERLSEVESGREQHKQLVDKMAGSRTASS